MPNKFSSVFHKEHIDRQEDGTKIVAEAFTKYAENKPQAVKDLVGKLLRPFVSGDTVVERMRNSDVLRIHQQLTDLENKIGSLDRLAVRLHNDFDDPLVMFDLALGSAPEILKPIKLGLQSFERESAASKNAMLPELRAGFSLALLQRAMKEGNSLSSEDARLLKSLLVPTGNDRDYSIVKLFVDPLANENASPESKAKALSHVLDYIKDSLFVAGSYDAHVRETDPIMQRPGLDYPLAPVYLKVDETTTSNQPPGSIKKAMGEFKTLENESKLDVLTSAFARHLKADTETTDQIRNPEDPREITADQRSGARHGNRQPAQGRWTGYRQARDLPGHRPSRPGGGVQPEGRKGSQHAPVSRVSPALQAR